VKHRGRQLDLLEGTVSAVPPPMIRAFLGEDEVIADNFCGGGGVSEAMRRLFGRGPDVAVNHSAEAIAMHSANHPETRHFKESVYKVDPRAACGGKRCRLAWFSPDCTHHSRAKGGKPRDQKIRGLAWIAVSWAHRVRPDIICLENVVEFREWGPLHKKHSDGCTGDNGPKNKKTGERGCRDSCQYLKPIKSRKGETFRAFLRKLAKLGYRIGHWVLRACDYGAPTKRERLVLVARCDGREPRRPAATHGPGLQPHRAAAECIDWSIPCPSIFEPGRDLTVATMARVARGAWTYVVNDAEPFIVTLRGTENSHIASSASSLFGPLRTISANGNHHNVVVPYLIHRSNGEREGQAPRIYDIRQPHPTVVAQGIKTSVVAAYLVKHYSERPTGGWNGGAPIDRPMDTVTATDHHSLAAAYLIRYNRTGVVRSVADPIGTIDTTDRYGLVTADLAHELTPEQLAGARRVASFLREHGYDVGEIVSLVIDGEEYVVIDLWMRFLIPRELFNAQGFPPSYRIDIPGPTGKPLSRRAQTKMCGNAVPPDLAAAAIAAQFQEAA
jgi:DNA (cytosine-5)-methyltransferase 1